MKNLHKLLLTSAFICSGAVSYASSNGHFYVGGQVGVLHGEPSGNVVVTNNDPNPTFFYDSQSFSTNDLSWGALGGYHYNVPFGFIGIEGFYMRESSLYKKDTSLGNGIAYRTSVRTTLKKDNSFGATTKVGWTLPKKPMQIYISLSLLTSSFNLTHNIEDSLNLGHDKSAGSVSRYLWAVAPGIGFNYTLNHKLSIKLDYQYRFYQEWKIRKTNDFKTNAGLSGNMRIRDQSFMIGLTYKI